MSWDSVVDTVTRLRVGRPGVLIPVGTRDTLLSESVHMSCGSHRTSYSMGTGALSHRREVDYSSI